MPSKLAMKAFASAMRKKKNQTEDEKVMAEMISHISFQTYSTIYFFTTFAIARPNKGGTELPICIYVFVYDPLKK